MQKPYKVTVNQKQKFDVSSQQANALDVVSVSDHKFHLLFQNKSHQVEIVASDFIHKNYTVLVNNTLHVVQIANELDQQIAEMGFALGATKQINAIKAPMPGLILEICVEVGQEVQENDLLLILEAMKMENSFASPRQGIIKSIAVSKGDAVDKGQLLIVFE
jgi:biotin carboxyl carrier protein